MGWFYTSTSHTSHITNSVFYPPTRHLPGYIFCCQVDAMWPCECPRVNTLLSHSQISPQYKTYHAFSKIVFYVVKAVPSTCWVQKGFLSTSALKSPQYSLHPVIVTCITHRLHHHHHHHHKHQRLDPLIRSVSKVTTAISNVSSVCQLFSFLVVCSSTISKGFGFVAFYPSFETSSIYIYLSCLLCL